jgi:hypothetical protein
MEGRDIRVSVSRVATHAPPTRRTADRWTHSGRPASYAPAGAVYRPRRPTATPLYPVVQHHLETFLAASAEGDPSGWGVPEWVEKDFRSYLECGVLAFGFARIRCGDCGEERLLAFSCKGRGVCPSCNARRMAEIAAHLTDHVLPHLPIRQWVLSLPKRLRPFLHWDPEVAGAVLGIFVRALRATLRRSSPTAPRGSELAAISFPQRFGSSLNPHYHFHVLAVDGVMAGGSGGVEFHEASGLTSEHWLRLERTVQKRVLRAFLKRGLIEEDAVQDMLTWQVSGGFSVDASVRIEGDDRVGIERLVRYCARGPLALERLHALDGTASLASPNARLVYFLPAPDPDGRTEIRLTPLELLDRLARLVPPPRIHRHRYHGALAPNARLRSAVVTLGRPVAAEVAPPADLLSGADSPRAEPVPEPRIGASARIPWAHLLARIYEVLPVLCPVCHGEMRVIAFLTDPPVVRGILRHLGISDRPPALTPARAPPQAEFEFDQTPALDSTLADPGPEFDLDQSLPDEWEC